MKFLKITPYDGGPTTVCGNCFEFITKINLYAEKCEKTDRMFTELIYRSTIQNVAENEENEILGIRMSYGMDDEEQVKLSDFPLQFKPQNDVLKIDQTTDTFDLIQPIAEVKEEAEIHIETGRKKSKFLWFFIFFFK